MIIAKGIAKRNAAQGVHGVRPFKSMSRAGSLADIAFFGAGTEFLVVIEPAFGVDGVAVELCEGTVFVVEEVILADDA